ncbi:MAG: DUF885 domain-containing protein [Acidimicrobiia bacterium]|nr:DUF885 domain-containing protein [Acidimicrobiia bacterium]
MIRQPQFLTSLGVAAEYGLRNDLLDDLSTGYLTETQTLEKGILELLQGFDRDALAPLSRTSFDVYEWWLDLQVDAHRFAYHDYPVHHFVNSYNDNLLLFLTEEHPLTTVDDAADYLSRLSQIDEQVAQLIESLERREEMGNIPPDFIVSMTISRLTGDLNGAKTVASARPATLPLYTTFRDRLELVDDLSDADRQGLLDEALRRVTESFVPAWMDLIEHMQSVQPIAGSDPGLWRLPDGDAYYQHLLREMTSTDLTADEIHQIGLDQVDRLQTELREVFDALGYPRDAATPTLLGRAASDAGFLSGSTAAGKQDIVAAWQQLIDDIDGRLDPYFNRRPAAGVIIIPEDFGAGGYYVAASVDGSRPGSFHAGVGGSSIPTYVMPTIAYHEAIPGHHLQIALAQELHLPVFRRYNQYNAYAEGWALYAERLAEEMGIYEDDPYGNIGRLELELVRAVRLVTDTGIHAMGWTRQQARDYMNSVVGWSHEVARYTVLPGQATGYMIGQQEILRLRQIAMDDLGDEFDYGAFHEAVLGAGSVPLEVLAETVGRWLDSQ